MEKPKLFCQTMMLSTHISQPLPSNFPTVKGNDKMHTLSMYEIEQNLIKKIVPMVVAIIKDTVAKRIFNSPTLTTCSDIVVVPAQAALVRTAIDKFIRVNTTASTLSTPPSPLTSPKLKPKLPKPACYFSDPESSEGLFEQQQLDTTGSKHH